MPLEPVVDDTPDLDGPLEKVTTWPTAPVAVQPPPPPQPLVQPVTEYDMDWNCAYGWLAEQAKKTGGPPGFAYVAMLAVFSGQGIPTCTRTTTRGTIFAFLAGALGAGKSHTIERVRRVLKVRPGTIVDANPGSDKGLQYDLALPPEEGAPKGAPIRRNNCVLHIDELRTLLAKIAIQNSGLPHALAALWQSDEYTTSTAQGPIKTNARMSLLGGMACRNPEAFGVAMGAATMTGLYDRLIVAPQTKPWYWDGNWQPEPSEIRHPWPTTIPREAITTLDAWIRTTTDAILAKNPESADHLLVGRIAGNIKRVALISASASHMSEVSAECMAAAIRFGEWQLKVKTDYAANSAENPDAVAQAVILKALQRLHDRDVKKYGVDGARLVWHEPREISRSGNLSRALGDQGPVVYDRCMRAMISLGLIDREPICDAEGEPKPGQFTKRVQLAD